MCQLLWNLQALQKQLSLHTQSIKELKGATENITF